MIRLERELSQGWTFSRGSEEAPFDFDAIDMPHDWAIEAPYQRRMNQGEPQGFLDRWGIGWYRLNIELDVIDVSNLYLLEFGGVYEDSTVWFNGVRVGGRKYGYSPFRCDISDAVVSGSNDLLIRVDNTKSPVDRWYSGAGIYRPVKLLILPERHLDPWEVVIRSTVEGTKAIVTVDPAITGFVKAEILDGSEVIAGVDGEGLLRLELSDVKRWSAESPKLYGLRLSCGSAAAEADRITINFGVRDIQICPDKGLFVNGHETKLKGVCLHQDVGCRGNASTKEVWRERLIRLKDMGCNSLRLSHHLFADFFLDLCDEMGFYVYEESFDKWTAGLYGRYFETEWEKDLEVMVKRDRNRPSIIIWGVGNEVEHQGQESMLAILKRMVDKIRSLDDRPVTYAMNPHFKERHDIDLSQIEDVQKFVDEEDEYEIYDNKERIRRIRRIADLIDIVSCNYMEQWYDLIRQAIPNKVILGSETYQYFQGHLDQMQHFTEDLPAQISLDTPYVIGSMIWTGYDYLGESMGWPAKGWGGALIRTNGEARPSYFLLQSRWSAKPMIHFSAMDYSQADEGVKEHWDIPMYASHWQFPQFHKTVIPYMISTNCDRVVLTLNDKPFYPASPKESPNGIIKGYLPWQPGRVEAIGYIRDEEVARHSLSTPTVATVLAFDEEEIVIETSGDVEKLFRVRALDAAGTPCYLEAAKVRFWVEGQAEIVGIDNGDLMRNEPYQGQSIHLYRGVASVQIRMASAAGRFVIAAAATGMKQGRVIVVVTDGCSP